MKIGTKMMMATCLLLGLTQTAMAKPFNPFKPFKPHPPVYQTTDLLARERLSDFGENTFVSVRSCERGLKVHSVLLRVLANPARLDRVVVRYADGQTQALDIRENFNAGGETRWVDLNGQARCITGVHVIGESTSPGWGDSMVEIWGRVSPN
jgi:hypothetical protein